MSVASVLHGELPEAEHRSQLRKAVIASTIGTTIEWYDFLLYSTVTGLVFGKLFFPHSDPLVGVLAITALRSCERCSASGNSPWRTLATLMVTPP